MRTAVERDFATCLHCRIILSPPRVVNTCRKHLNGRNRRQGTGLGYPCRCNQARILKQAGLLRIAALALAVCFGQSLCRTSAGKGNCVG